MLPYLYICLGLLPSLIWLIFYLKKDIHPEPKKKIVAVFFGGAISAVLAGAVETLIIKKAGLYCQGSYQTILLFLIIAAIEEISKYLPFKIMVAEHKELDEPIDVPEYMITSALGFAAFENIFLFFSSKLKFLEIFLVSGFRFIGATLLHAVCSGLLGYFIALSFAHNKKGRIKSRLFTAFGFLVAMLLHTAYNFSIIKSEDMFRLAVSFIILGLTAFFLSCGLKKLIKSKAVCKN